MAREVEEDDKRRRAEGQLQEPEMDEGESRMRQLYADHEAHRPAMRPVFEDTTDPDEVPCFSWLALT